MPVVSKGTTLSFCATKDGTFKKLTKLKSIPDIKPKVSKLECTDLDSECKKYADGIKDYGDGIDFGFYYETGATESYEVLKGLTGEQFWKITFPDNMTIVFPGTPVVGLDGVEVDKVMTFTLSVTPTGDFEI